MLHGIHRLLYGRLWEWAFSAGLLWFAVEIMIWPDAISKGIFSHLKDFMSVETVTGYSLAISLCGLAALATNGYSTVVGPAVRSACAIGRSFLWAQLSFSLFTIGQSRSSPAAGLGFWVVFTIAELYVAYRAMTDVQRAL